MGTWYSKEARRYGRRGGERPGEHRGPPRAAVVLVLALASVVGGSVSLASPAGAVTAPSFTLEPQSPQGAITPRGDFSYNLRPGQSVDDAVILTNTTAAQEVFRIWPSDAYNTAVAGGYALRPVSYQNTGVGSWIRLPVTNAAYALPANTSVTLHFTLTVPANAIPGTNAGGITALDVTPPGPASSGGTHVKFNQGLAVAVIVNVAGPIHASAAVSNISVTTSTPAFGWATGSSSARTTFDLENTGDTMLRGNATATVTDIFGRTVKSYPRTPVQNFVPGQRFTVVEPTWTSLPILGPLTVHVTFTALGADAPAPVHGQQSFWILPWLLILIVVLVIALLVLFVLRRRRRPGAQSVPPGTEAGTEAAASEVPAPVSTNSDSPGAVVAAGSSGPMAESSAENSG